MSDRDVRLERRGARGRARRGAGRARDGAGRATAARGSPSSSRPSTRARSTGASAEALEELLELGLQTGRLRALYGPGGEQAALLAFRRLPRGAELARGAREVTEALAALEGRRIDSVSLANAGPGAYVLSLAADGLELSVRLDRQGARIHSVGV